MPNQTSTNKGYFDWMNPEDRISRAIDGLKIKENELYDVSFTLEFLSWVARLVEEAKNADPDEKTDLSHLSGKVVDGLDRVFDLLHTHTAWMAEDLSRDIYVIEKAVQELKGYGKSREETQAPKSNVPKEVQDQGPEVEGAA